MSEVENYVQLNPDSTGKKMRTREATVSGNTVEQEVLVLADPNTPSQMGAVDASGAIQTFSREPLIPAAPAGPSVSGASGQIVAANASRKGLVIVNTTTGNISLAFGANAAVLGSGITLYPNGAWEMDEWTFSILAINAIAADPGSVAVQEFN